MGGSWRLPVCVVAVVLAHAGLGLAWLHVPAVSAQHGPLHRTAPIRLVVLEPTAEPAAPSPPPVPPAIVGDSTAAVVLPSPGPADRAAAPQQPPNAARTPALAPERTVSQPSPAAPAIAPPHDFLSPAQVERGPIAFPSPDMAQLSGLTFSGKPIRLRLFVAADGRCVDVQVLSASEDPATLDRLRQMFLATHFLPARLAGADVGAYRDLELDVTDVK